MLTFFFTIPAVALRQRFLQAATAKKSISISNIPTGSTALPTQTVVSYVHTGSVCAETHLQQGKSQHLIIPCNIRLCTSPAHSPKLLFALWRTPAIRQKTILMTWRTPAIRQKTIFITWQAPAIRQKTIFITWQAPAIRQKLIFITWQALAIGQKRIFITFWAPAVLCIPIFTEYAEEPTRVINQMACITNPEHKAILSAARTIS